MNFKEICRTCLCSSRTMYPIFQVDLGNSTVIDLLKIFTEILISHNDGFPDQICMNCIDEIKRSYAFKLKCEKSQVALIEMKNSSKQTNADHRGIRNNVMPDSSLLESVCIKEEVMDYDLMDITLEQHSILSNTSSPATKYLHRKSTEEATSTISGYAVKDEDGRTESNQLEIKHELEISNFDQDQSTISNYEDLSLNFADLNQQEFNKIYETDEPNKTYLQCPACSEEFEENLLLQKHIFEKHTEGNTCKLCDQSFVFNIKMWNHCAKHFSQIDSAELKCFECKKVFRLEEDLQKHNLKVHQITGICKYCSIEFLDEKKFEEHFLGQTEKNDLQCTICSKSLPCRSLLTAHMRVHTKCSICSKTFSRQYTLKRHMIIYHSKESDLTCNYCFKTFEQINQLKEHSYEHTGELQFKCHFCLKFFSGLSNLRTHLKTHSGRKPFKCDYCAETFNNKLNFKSHMTTVHKNKVVGKSAEPCTSGLAKKSRKAKCRGSKSKGDKSQKRQSSEVTSKSRRDKIQSEKNKKRSNPDGTKSRRNKIQKGKIQTDKTKKK